jgi:transcriptional regulator with GAF, ATPase, and Fis domain
VFLDEIGELSGTLQGKILRAIEERSFERVGGTALLHVDVRIVAATNKNLRAAVAAHRFREDLFFRLSVFPITIPPLRERQDDIPMLARHFIERFSREVKKRPLVLSLEAERELRSYGWPGNVRELQNCIERTVILADTDIILSRHLHLKADAIATPVPEPDPWDGIDLSGTLEEASRRIGLEVERRKIARALAETGGDGGRASELLGIGYKTFSAKARQHRLD